MWGASVTYKGSMGGHMGIMEKHLETTTGYILGLYRGHIF